MTLRAHNQMRVPPMRSTTGAPMAVRYDQRSNTLVIVEEDWSAESFRTGALPRSEVRLRPDTPVARFRRKG